MSLLRVIAAGLLILSLTTFFQVRLDRLEPEIGSSLGELWGYFHRESLVAFRAFLQNQLPSIAWDEGLKSALRMPAWSVFGSTGLLLYLVSLKRHRGIDVYAPTTDEVGVQGLQNAPHSELRAALVRCRAAFVSIGLFSGVSNVLMLTGSFYMLEVYDRVLPSRSVPTLVALSVLAALLFTFQGMIDLIRGRLLVRVAASLDEALGTRVYDSIVLLPFKTDNSTDGLQPLRDLDSVRSFLSGQGPTALFDIPWMPLYLAIIFAFHPVLGVTALAGAMLLICLTVLTEGLTRGATKSTTSHAIARNRLADTSRRNAEVLLAMGMANSMRSRWEEVSRSYMTSQRDVSDVASGLGSIAKVLRMMLQSAMLGLGAYLVVRQEASGGIIIAGAILTSRALAPVDLAIANWRGFVAARQSWQRLASLLSLFPLQNMPLQLPAPRHGMSVENACAAPPGSPRLVVVDVSFAVKSGQGLGIVGPSASGKSSLARMLVGVWRPARGKIRLDGAALDQWAPDALGRHVGYLPQNVELLAGTIAENISRFDLEAEPQFILAAAQAAGIHDLIVTLPNGYETQIGEQGSTLSAGQQQRVALARALYRDPFLVVLDEPNSNLDAEGEAALTQAILSIRSRGGIAVVIAHRPSALAGVDTILVMGQGRALAVGPKDEVLAKMVRSTSAPVPFKITPEATK